MSTSTVSTIPRSRDNLLWLAGLMEGEGSFGWHQIKKRPNTSGCPVIQIKMTDQDVMEKVARLFRKPLRQYGKTKRNKLIWAVTFNGKDAAGWMQTLYSHLGQRRKARIREVIQRWQRVPNRKNL